jgi:hypothetical protein
VKRKKSSGIRKLKKVIKNQANQNLSTKRKGVPFVIEPIKSIKVKSIIQAGFVKEAVHLELFLGDDNFQVIEFNWREFASVYKYLSSKEDDQSKANHECKDCPKCGHPDCRHTYGLCDYARDCACDYYVEKK